MRGSLINFHISDIICLHRNILYSWNQKCVEIQAQLQFWFVFDKSINLVKLNISIFLSILKWFTYIFFLIKGDDLWELGITWQHQCLSNVNIMAKAPIFSNPTKLEGNANRWKRGQLRHWMTPIVFLPPSLSSSTGASPTILYLSIYSVQSTQYSYYL